MAKVRMAGNLLNLLKNNFSKAYANKADVAWSVLPDVGFGVMTGAMTPGDLGDKLIAGTTDAVIGAGMTGGLRGATGATGALGTAIEWGGGMASGFASYPVAEQLLRVKGGGKSPYDKLQEEQYKVLRAEVEREVLNQLMRGQRTPVVGDPFLQQNGLG